MIRLPIRARLTASFVVVMALLLTATGAFIYHRQSADLNRTIDRDLRARVQELSALLDGTGGDLEPIRAGLTGHPGDVGQVIDRRGRMFALSTASRGRTLLTPSQLAIARRRALLVDGSLRVYALPHTVEEHQYVLVVASSLTERDATLRSLMRELLLGGSGALLIAALFGFAVASAALRPVEAMRARAESITDLQSGERLPEPRTRDEIGRLATTLNEMLSRLQEVLVRERAFIADASHELRTPLTVLRTELELALSQPRSAQELEASILSAREETDQLGRLADDLLLLARSDSERRATTKHPVDVAEMLSLARDQARRHFSELDRQIDIDPDVALVVNADASALSRAIGNLLDNALRHGAGDVLLSATAADGYVEIDVRDHGAGLDDLFAAHAFERFARAPVARSQPGTGLGLAIVQAIADAHQGTAGIESDPQGAGTRAWIRIREGGQADPGRSQP